MVNDLFIYTIAGIFTIIVTIVSFVSYKILQKKNRHKDYLIQLDEIIEETDSYEKKESFYYKWNTYWSQLLKSSGIERYGEENNKAGTDIILFFIVFSLLIGIILKNFVTGIAFSSTIIILIVLFLKNRSNKKEEQIFQQLSGFLFAFKANIDARRTPQEAFVKIVDDLPSPLREELLPVKQSIIANMTFEDALTDLRNNSSSHDLRFLAACILQANKSGGDLKEQINTIQKIIKSRQQIKDEITKGYKTAKPVIAVASVVLPGLMIYMLLTDDFSQKFWFVEPISYPIFVIAATLYIGGIFMSKKMVDKIKKY